MKKSVLLLIILFVCLSIIDVHAQCPMCRMSAESNLREAGTEGIGLNRGILYMLSLPYLLVASLGFLWWKNRRKLSDEIYTEPFSDN
ncbi:MAG: hypothetical protein HKN67_00375 [Saprospiraceae bacterium]|nr:hypothetical protein [Saprospiraceae bacterium]